MSAYFVDTSALARRYLAEIGFQWVRTWVDPIQKNDIVISEITPVEMLAILARRTKGGRLKTHTATRLRRVFLAHVELEYLVITVDRLLLLDARTLTTQYGLRTLDAIQLACAMQGRVALGHSMRFISSDNELLAAASAEGFQVDNPFLHP